ncbi:MAG: TonB-dependent receptor [Hydrogenobaculum sp.]
MVRKMLLSLCVLSSAGLANDLSSVFILKPLKIFGLPKSFEAFKSKKNLSRNNSLDLAQALNKEVGIFNYSKGVIANDIVLNGLNRDNINLLIDGTRIYGACPARMDVPAFHIPLNFIQGVKIVYGPYDITHQGSMGGLIDVKTIYPKLGFHSNLSFNANSYGFLNPNVEASYNNGKFYFVAGYSFKTAEPYKDAHGVKITNYIPNEYKSTPTHDFNINSYMAKFGFTPTTDTDIGLSYIKQSANNVLYPFLSMDAIYDRSNIVNFHIDKDNISKDLKNIRFKTYYTDVYHLMTNQFRQTRMYMATYARTKTYGSSISADILNTDFGIDFYRRNWYAANQIPSRMTPPYIIPDVFITNLGAFAKKSFLVFKNLKLSLGLRIDNTKSSPDGSLIAKNSSYMTRYNYKSLYGVNPSDKTDTYLSGYIKLEKPLSENNTFYAGFGHTVRVPDPEERYIYFINMGKYWIGNPNLKPAKNNEVDVGFSSKYDKFSLNLDAYYRYIEDYITITQFKQGTNMINEYWNTTAFMDGLNIDTSYRLTKTISLDSKTSYVRGYQITNKSKHITSPNLPDIPPLREILSLRYDDKKYFGTIETILDSTQNKVNTDLKEQKIPGYGIINVYGGLNLENGASITLGIDNLLNQEYYSYNDYYSNPFNEGVKLPEPGRTFYINVQYSF